MGGIDQLAPSLEPPPHQVVLVGRQAEGAQLDADASAASFFSSRIAFSSAEGSAPFPVIPEPHVLDGRGAPRLLQIGPARQQHDLARTGGQHERTGRRRSRSYRSRSGSRGSPARTEEWRRASRAAALRVRLRPARRTRSRSKCRAMGPSLPLRLCRPGELAPHGSAQINVPSPAALIERPAIARFPGHLAARAFDTCNRLISLTCSGAMR